jgi:DNA-binding SARP family transcriptional activator
MSDEQVRSLELVCFGPPTARLDGGDPPPDVVWRKHLALLIYLAASPDRQRSRDHLMGVLWPDKPQAKARHSLNEAVRRLRAGLGSARLVTQGESLSLSGELLDVDAVRFRDRADDNPDEALTLVRGDFLEGFVVDDARPFEDWASAQRSEFQQRVNALLLVQGEAALEASRFGEAARAARRALGLSALWEPAINLLMRAEVLEGDASGALAAFHEFSQRLRDEIGEEPSSELSALAQRIRSGVWMGPSDRPGERRPPLVGRRQVHDRVFGLLAEGMRRGPRTLVITGDPGFGKTRLLDECVERLTLHGAHTVVARPLPTDVDAPLSSLRLLLDGGLGKAPRLGVGLARDIGCGRASRSSGGRRRRPGGRQFDRGVARCREVDDGPGGLVADRVRGECRGAARVR